MRAGRSSILAEVGCDQRSREERAENGIGEAEIRGCSGSPFFIGILRGFYGLTKIFRRDAATAGRRIRTPDLIGWTIRPLTPWLSSLAPSGMPFVPIHDFWTADDAAMEMNGD